MLNIRKTNDYSQFRKYERTNRDVSKSSVNALVASIQQKNMLESHPILIDRDNYIIDGQHRLEAAKILNIPIFFVVDEKVEEQDIPRCQIQKKWESSDYLKYYKEVNDDYGFVHEIYEKFGFNGHLPFVISSCASIASAGDAFRKGTFKITKSKLILRKKFEQIKEIKEAVKRKKENVYFSAESLKALWALVGDPKYNHKIMLDKTEKYIDNFLFSLNFKKKPTILDSLRDRVYNYFNKKADKIGQD